MNDPLTLKTFNEYLLVDKTSSISKSPKRWDHYHDFYEIYYSLGNEMNYFIDNEVYTINKDDIVFIQPFRFHRTVYSSESQRARILILFHPMILQQTDFYDSYNLSKKVKELFLSKKKISFKSDKSKEQLYHAMIHLYNISQSTQTTFKDVKMQCALIQLFATILDLTSDENLEQSVPMLSPKEKLTYQVIRYINENYTLDITLEKICQDLYVSKSYLCHVFKEITGVTVINFINRKRLSESERLLRYSSLNVTDICHKVGFNSVGYFINLFSKNYKCTPNAFRKQLKNSSL